MRWRSRAGQLVSTVQDSPALCWWLGRPGSASRRCRPTAGSPQTSRHRLAGMVREWYSWWSWASVCSCWAPALLTTPDWRWGRGGRWLWETRTQWSYLKVKTPRVTGDRVRRDVSWTPLTPGWPGYFSTVVNGWMFLDSSDHSLYWLMRKPRWLWPWNNVVVFWSTEYLF